MSITDTDTVRLASGRRATDIDGDRVARLVMAAGAGDQGAWEDLVGRYSGLAWSIARSYRLTTVDAAEVSQAVWLSLVGHLDRLREPRSVGAWLASVTRHECLQTIRKADREVPVADIYGPYEREGSVSVDGTLLADERRAALYRALGQLPPRWQALMRILMADPCPSYAEVAAALDIPIGSIGPIRQRCLARLRNSEELLAFAE